MLNRFFPRDEWEMASKDDHLWQANHNEQLYSQLSNTDFLDWAVTLIFYSALHYVDAYLATKNVHIQFDHGARERWITRDSNLRRIQRQYWDLKDASEDARYKVRHFRQAEVESLKENQFEMIKSHMLRYLL